MSTDSLLAALALRLSFHPENIATEALLHVLGAHHGAIPALGAFLRNAGLPEMPPLFFKSQAFGEGGSIPDLVGCDAENRERLVIEAKFWADLTDHQPETYLKRLAADAPSVLLFIGPQARQRSLWDRLVSRVPERDIPSTSLRESELLLSCSVGESGRLAVTSWRAVLASLGADAAARGERGYQSDVEQLQGLCNRMDSEAFLPIRPSELSQEIGRRVQQYADLVEGTFNALRRLDAKISTKGARSASSGARSGQYFVYESIGAYLMYSPVLWARHGGSPIWLGLRYIDPQKGWIDHPSVRETLGQLMVKTPSRLADDWGMASLALNIPLMCGKSEVVDGLAKETLEVLKVVESRVNVLHGDQ